MSELCFNGEIYYHSKGSFSFTEESILNILAMKMEARYLIKSILKVNSPNQRIKRKLIKKAQKKKLQTKFEIALKF